MSSLPTASSTKKSKPPPPSSDQNDCQDPLSLPCILIVPDGVNSDVWWGDQNFEDERLRDGERGDKQEEEAPVPPLSSSPVPFSTSIAPTHPVNSMKEVIYTYCTISESIDPIPLCCSQLPSGTSLMMSNIISLKHAGTRDIYILVTASHVESVRQHVQEKAWRKLTRGLNIEYIPLGSNVSTVCEMIRESFSKLQRIRSDFILMFANSFVLSPLPPLIAFHLSSKALHPSCAVTRLMTRVEREGREGSSLYHMPYDNNLLVINQSSGLVLSAVNINGKGVAELDLAILGQCSSISLNCDLVEGGVDICSFRVLEIINEAFDYMHLRDDLIFGIINQELKLESVFVYILEGLSSQNNFPDANQETNSINYRNSRNGISFRVPTFESLMSAMTLLSKYWSTGSSDDLPNGNESPEISQFSHSSKLPSELMSVQDQPGVYIPACLDLSTCSNVILAAPVILWPGVVEDNIHISNSFIGKNCTIRSNVHIYNSIILDNVVIGEGVKCSNMYINRNVEIGRNSVLTGPAYIGVGVKIAESHVVPEKSHVSRMKLKKDKDSSLGYVYISDLKESEALSDSSLVGKGGVGYRHPMNLTRPNQALMLPTHAPPSDHEEGEKREEAEGSEGDSEDEIILKNKMKDGGGVISLKTENDEEEGSFFQETYAMAYEGIETPEHMSNKLLEIKSYRLACNKRLLDCISPVLRACLDALGRRFPTAPQAGVRSLKVADLLTAVADTEEEEAQFELFDSLLAYCQRPFISPLPNAAVDSDGGGNSNDEVKSPNVFNSSNQFVRLVQILSKEEALNDDFLPDWWRETNSRFGKESRNNTSLQNGVGSTNITSVLEFVNGGPMKQYIEWLENDDSSDDDD